MALSKLIGIAQRSRSVVAARPQGGKRRSAPTPALEPSRAHRHCRYATRDASRRTSGAERYSGHAASRSRSTRTSSTGRRKRMRTFRTSLPTASSSSGSHRYRRRFRMTRNSTSPGVTATRCTYARSRRRRWRIVIGNSVSGLGQVLQYAKQLEARGETVRALILTPTSDEGDGDVWKRVMQDAGIAWLSRSLVGGEDDSARAALLATP